MLLLHFYLRLLLSIISQDVRVQFYHGFVTEPVCSNPLTRDTVRLLFSWQWITPTFDSYLQSSKITTLPLTSFANLPRLQTMFVILHIILLFLFTDLVHISMLGWNQVSALVPGVFTGLTSLYWLFGYRYEQILLFLISVPCSSATWRQTLSRLWTRESFPVWLHSLCCKDISIPFSVVRYLIT